MLTPPSPLARARARGFTLIELLTVVALIGIIAAASAPSILKAMQDNRVQKASYRVAEVVRFAKSRAIGRGAAVLVRWDVNHGMPTLANLNGRLTVREAIRVSAAGPVPSASCFTTDWGDASTTSRYVASFDDRFKLYQPSDGTGPKQDLVTFLDPNNTLQPIAHICFSPRGRTFVRYGSAGPFAPLTGVPHFSIINPESTFARKVIVPPNGVARVSGEIN